MMEIINTENLSLIGAWASNLFAGFAILCIGIYISRKANKLLRHNATLITRFDKTLAPLIASIVSYGIMIITIVAALGSVGIQTTSIIAVLGAAGLAIGLALQGTLSNVAAGVMLLFLRPFQINDWVETAGHSGTITEIGLFTTTMVTFDQVFVSIPNSAIWGAVIINHARNTTRRMDLDIGIAYDTDLALAEKTLLALAEDKRILKTPKPEFLVASYADSAIVVRLRVFAHYNDFFDLYWDLMRRLKPALDTAGIGIPFPQIEYRLVNGDKA